MRSEPGPGPPTHLRFETELDRLRQDSLYRRLHAAERPDFCSNDYLGLAHSAALIEAAASAAAGAKRAGSTGSRLLSGHGPEWEALEAEFAQFAGAESSLYLGSGYAANVGLLSAVIRPEDTVFSDASNHASLIDGIRLSGGRKVIVPHLDLDAFETALASDDGTGERFIVVESLYSMDGDRAPIDDLATLAGRYRAGLIIDEAHATGVFGRQGRGLISDTVRESDVLIAAVHTCGKALASPGAFVTGSRNLVDFLINTARTFIFSTALPPFVAGQVSAAIRLVREADEERARVLAHAARLREGLRGHGIDIGAADAQIVPVMLGSNRNAVEAAERLAGDGFLIRPIRPPTVPVGTARLRLSVTADTHEDTIDKVIEAIAAIDLR
jgi:8-amino-7-oxononanoate synthase